MYNKYTNLYFLFLFNIFTFSSIFIISKSKDSNNNEYIYRKKADMLLEEFFNIEKNSNKTYKEYIEDLIFIMKKLSKEGQEFSNRLQKLKDSKNHVVVCLVFWKYRKLFSKDVVNKLLSYDRKILIDAFYIRNGLKKRG